MTYSLKLKNETKNSNIKFLDADLSSINETSLLANKLISEKIECFNKQCWSFILY